MTTDDQHQQSMDQSNRRIEFQRQASTNGYRRGLRLSRTPNISRIPNNNQGVSGSGNLSAYLLLVLLSTLVGGALLINWLLQIEPYSFDLWEAPPISSPQKDKR